MQARLQSYSQSDYAKSTSSFFSNVLTTTTSKYNTLRRQLVSSETDGDTEDDSHIARALRAYYTEKAKAFPEWLPPDPNQKQALPVQVTGSYVSSTGGLQAPSQVGGQQQAGGARWRQGSGLSDLWGDGGHRPQNESQSLRQRATPAGQSMTTQQGRFGAVSASQQAAGQETLSRPLPSQRAGSYQSVGQQSSSSRFETASPPPTSSSAGSSAQERLKARLWGAGRTGSPPTTGNSAFRPPPVSSGSDGSSSRNPYENVGSGPSRNNPYANSGGGAGGQSRPMVSANAPWSGGDDYGGPAGFAGGYGDDGRRPVPSGLPSGPRAGRQGSGLPSGPRPPR